MLQNLNMIREEQRFLPRCKMPSIAFQQLWLFLYVVFPGFSPYIRHIEECTSFSLWIFFVWNL